MYDAACPSASTWHLVNASRVQDFDKNLVIGGLILNKVGGQAHLTWLKEAMEAADVKAPVLGGLPKVCDGLPP
jgi:cobyrinic acid a,c-diamide synthase